MAHLEEVEVIGENPENESCCEKLLQENRISNIEYQIIKDAIQSDEQIATLYQELTTKEDEESVLDILDKMSRHLHIRNYAETEEVSSQSSDSFSHVVQEKNPLLNDLVIECLFAFLPCNDILQCRLVNGQWNKEAESILHKRRVKIYFNSAEQSPSTFLSNSFLSDPLNPFNDFTFLPCPNYYNGGKWQVAELSHFFYNWGDKVEKLKFKNIVLVTPSGQCERHGLRLQLAYRMMDLISRTPNLSHLDINCEGGTPLIVNHSHLTQIKFLSLAHCCLEPGIDSEPNAIRIRPSTLRLENVVFQLKNSSLGLINLNYFFDLDTATHINLSNNRMDYRMGVLGFTILNMSAHVFNADMLSCENVILQNWEHAEGIINYLCIKDMPLRHKTHLQIKQICARNPSIDLSVLPITVEKINLPMSELITRSEDEIELPNLTSVHFQIDDQSHDTDALNQFTHFPSLVDLKFVLHRMAFVVDMSTIPTSVKRVKIVTTEFFDFQEDWDMSRQLESLILENFATRLNEVVEILEKVKTKVLVISWNGKGTMNTNGIVDFVRRVNQRVAKIIIGTKGDAIDLHKCNSPFEQSRFSSFVDQKKANHYLFENEKATPLTLAEFEDWEKMDDAFDDVE